MAERPPQDGGCRCVKGCALFEGRPDQAPPDCPTRLHADVLARAGELCRTEGTDAHRLWQAFGRLIGTGGAAKSRVEHVVDFARALGEGRIGIASCLRYIEDARFLRGLLRAEGFDAPVVLCKVGGWTVRDVGVDRDTDWIVCNPAGQALILNKLGCGVQLTLGLCMGHEMIFNKYSTGYVTNLYVKEKISEERPRDTVRAMMRGEYVCRFHRFGEE